MRKVSIVVPIYNAESYLKKCIDSLVEQTYENLEIILVNDGSKDNSEKIIKSYDDSRIVYIKKNNTGIGDTRNKGIARATGAYLMFLDSDDYYERDCVEKMVEKLESSKYDLVVADYYIETPKNVSEVHFNLKDGHLKDHPEYILNINMAPWNKIYKLSDVKKSKNTFPKGVKYEDVPFVVKAIANASQVGFIHEPLFHYVIKKTGETITRDYRLFDIFKICDMIDEITKDNPNIDSTSLMVKILSHYIRTSNYIEDLELRDKFLKEVYTYLNKYDKKWKKCSYLSNMPYKNRLLITNPKVVKLYSKMKH